MEREWIDNIRAADPQSFDAITMFGVIYLAKEHDTVIASVCDALKPGGFLIFNDGVILYQVRLTEAHVGDFQGDANMIHHGKREGVCHGGGGWPSGGLRGRADCAIWRSGLTDAAQTRRLVGAGGDL